VTIVDVNDNAPVFLAGASFRLTVPESSPVGAAFPLPLATDPDTGDNGALEYRLSEPSDHFRLAVDTASTPYSSQVRATSVYVGWRRVENVRLFGATLYTEEVILFHIYAS